MCDRTGSPRNDLGRLLQRRRLDNCEPGYGKGRRHERPVLRGHASRVSVAHLDGPPGDAHVKPLLVKAGVIGMRLVPDGWVGSVVTRLVAVADGYELRHLTLLWCPVNVPSTNCDVATAGNSSPARRWAVTRTLACELLPAVPGVGFLVAEDVEAGLVGPAPGGRQRCFLLPDARAPPRQGR